MEEDPWGAPADPWGASVAPGSTSEVDLAISPSPENQDPILATKLAVPRNDSLSESDPWASPATAKTNVDATLTPVSTIAAGTNGAEMPSLSHTGWEGSRDTDDNAWSKSPLAVPVVDLPIETPESSMSETLVAEHTPLPLDEEEATTKVRADSAFDRPSTEDGWGVPRSFDNPREIAVAAPTYIDTASRTSGDNETLNPFPQEDEKAIAPAKEPPLGLSATALEDDDGFGGFAAGGFQKTSGGFGFAKEDDAYGGWGKENVAASFGNAEDAWESTSAGFGAEDRGQASNDGRNLEVDRMDNDYEDGFHSIPAKPKTVVISEQLQEDTWEQERRKLETQEARAPIELINKLVDQWKDVLEQVYIVSESQNMGKEVEDGLDHETVIRKDRLTTKLTELPDSLSIFVPPVRNTVTWARYQDYLSTIKLDPSASILAKASAESAYRAARRKSQEEHDAWQARSRLGETSGLEQSHQPTAALSQENDATRSRWSLWGRKPSAPVVPLATSGGGLLEIKAMSPNHTGTHVKDKASVNGHSSSASIPSHNELPMRSTGTPTPAEVHINNAEPAPSAVGRFFGRFRRTPNTASSVDFSNRDLELTRDDFSFLADVPSTAPKAVVGGDLLSLDNDERPSEQMASLEAILNSRATPPPPKPTPPSRIPAIPGHFGGQLAETAIKSKANSVIDLFGDLDLTGSTTAGSSPIVTTGSGSTLAFDAFASTSNPPALSPDLAVRPQSLIAQQGYTADALVGNTASLDDEGFGEFGVPVAKQTNRSADFDDFGDFEQFAVQPKSQRHAYAGQSTKPYAHANHENLLPSTPGQEIKKAPIQSSSRFDHSSTARLVGKAAQSPSQWPAPKSPSIPALPPPIPPPTARQPAIMTSSVPSSRAGTPLNFDFLAAGPSMLAPTRTNTLSPASPAPGAANIASLSRATPSLSKGNGLSASDLSFFDSL